MYHSSESSSIDPARLEKVRHRAGGKLVARCPACAATGGDRQGDHLVVFPSGRFACAAFPGDREHRRQVFALAGRPSSSLPSSSPGSSFTASSSRYSEKERREWRDRLRAEEQRLAGSRRVTELVRQHARENILASHPWTRADAWHDSPQIPDSLRVRRDARHFLASLFPPQALLWTGAVHDSGSPRHSAHWRTCAEWQEDSGRSTDAETGEGDNAGIGPMTTPAVWLPGTTSRAAAEVRSAPYVVLDFDGLDGIHPDGDPESLRAHAQASLSLTCWLREHLRWRLAAIVWTGGKSLHAWFHHPGTEAVESLAGTATAFGVDPGLLGRPEHPCRLPGQRHAGTGRISEVLWLQLPESAPAE